MTGRPTRRLREQVRRRARSRCEYCLIHEDDSYARHQLDHITAVRHGGETTLQNLALACFLCNRHKGSDVAALIPQPATSCACSIRDANSGRITSPFKAR